MPLYEYACEQCKKNFEAVQKFSDAPLEKCPECQGSVTKVMSLGGFALKGTGWYATDYKKKSEGVVAPAAPSAPKESPKKSSES